MEEYDAVIIGFGKGGKTLAAHLASKRKKRVALIEQSDRMYGGTCINVGCIPSKSLILAAQRSEALGGTFEEKARRYAEAIEKKRALVSMLRKKNFDKLDKAEGVTVLNGRAAFISPSQVKVETEKGGQVVSGKKFFINTGSVPFIPPVEGLEGSPYAYTSEGMMELEALPRRLAIIGGGYIGTEFASMYAAFGSEVTVIQDGETFLAREDEDISREVKGILEEKGVVFRLGAQLHSVADGNGHARLRMAWQGGEKELEADAVLVATGRIPNTEGLNLAAAGIETTPRGGVKTDALLRTSAPNIWAMGDVRGGLQFTYISLDDFRVVWSQIGGGIPYTEKERKNIPNSVFTDPPLSTVGMKEKEAREAGYRVRIARLPAAAVPKAQVLGQTRGLLKAVIDADTNRILGASFLCAESHEIINTVKLAMDLKAGADVLGRQVFTHPTMSEALNDLFAPGK